MITVLCNVSCLDLLSSLLSMLVVLCIIYVEVLIVQSLLCVLPLQLNPCLTALGYSLCYGTILMKMIRVWYIFNNPTLQKKIVSAHCYAVA